MAYQINKTDGTIVATVADGQVDNLSTDLTLIGKNYSGFGESLNENFVKLLENFSSTAAPVHPIKGQIWFDTSENKLKVYNGSDFIPVSSATIASTQPDTLAIGDLWWSDSNGQLYFYDGTDPILIGPAYSLNQGLSGLKVDSILDTLNQTRVITYLYNNGILLGIFAKDSFTPRVDIIGFSGSIAPGFNAGTLAGIKFNVTCTNAEQLGGVIATTYVRRDTSNAVEGQLRITTDLGVVVGSAGQMNLYVSGGDIYMSNAATDRKLILNVRKGINQEDAISIDSTNRAISLYAGYSDSLVNLGGSLTIDGNLTVNGATTTLSTADLAVTDKNIIIANVSTPTDSTADGAGITIKGTTDKTISYSAADDRLDISENVNLESGRSYSIGGFPMIEPSGSGDGNYKLGLKVTAIPGVNSFGAQIFVDVGPDGVTTPASPGVTTHMRLIDHSIVTVKNNYNIQLLPDGTGHIELNDTAKIIKVADPTDPQDAATKEYVDKTVESKTIIFSMDLSDGRSDAFIGDLLTDYLAPPAEFRNGTFARILCTLISNSTTLLDINGLPPSITTAPFLTNLSGATSNALVNISFPEAIIPASSISTTRIVKLFKLEGIDGVGAGRQWVWQSEVIL